MVPRQMRETFNPVDPSLVYCIMGKGSAVLAVRKGHPRARARFGCANITEPVARRSTATTEDAALRGKQNAHGSRHVMMTNDYEQSRMMAPSEGLAELRSGWRVVFSIP